MNDASVPKLHALTDRVSIPVPTPWEPAIKMRWVDRDGQKVLQQMYWRRTGNEMEHSWVDVPVVKEKRSADQPGERPCPTNT
jgi:hypothetical protein